MKKTSKMGIIVGIIAAIMIVGGSIVWRELTMKEVQLSMLDISQVQNRFYKNPITSIFEGADPFVMRASDGNYYCYPTSWNIGFKAWVSKDLVQWEEVGPVYESKGGWAFADFWAPEVVEYEGKFYMYYTARWSKTKSLRIGVAVSDSPRGPFIDVYDHPMFDFGYAAIDAHVLIDDDGKKYLYYSRDCSENVYAGRNESHIYGIELSEDMISVVGEPTLLLKPDQEWEFKSGDKWRWNEGPEVLKKNGLYYLMYSGNLYAHKAYSIGYATAQNPLGEYVKYDQNPIIEAKEEWDHVSGTGHHSMVLSPDGSEWIMIYHAHTVPAIGGGNRQVYIDRMGFREDGSIYVNGPTVTEQLIPSGAGAEYNAAGTAQVTVSSEKSGYKKESLIDGEIGIYEKFEKQEWVAEDGEDQSWVQLTWKKKQPISGVVLYPSAIQERNVQKCKIVFSNGSVVENVAFPSEPGGAAIINFEEMDVKWMKVIIDHTGQEIGLSEIMVISSQDDTK